MTDMMSRVFGITQDGTAVMQFILRENNITASIIEYGATLTNLFVPDRDGHAEDVVLGYDSLREYEDQSRYLGAVIGRCANRISNASFDLNGISYHLYPNNGKNHLHGGKVGFDKRVWYGEPVENGVKFTLHSAHMEEGYPGDLSVCVTYTLKNSCLGIRYTAVSDRDTIVNLTNHSYFNLSSDPHKTIEDHLLKISSLYYCKCDPSVLVTGIVSPVAGTPFDFTCPHRIGERLRDANAQLIYAKGYDHNFVLAPAGNGGTAAEVSDPGSGRKMQIKTDLSAMQLYTGNYLFPTNGKGGVIYENHTGVCFETQFYPDAINKKEFPSPVLRAGETYDHWTQFCFSSSNAY